MAAVEGSSPRAPPAWGPHLPGQHRLLPGLTMAEQGTGVNTGDLWLLCPSGRWVQDGGVWPRKEE